MKARSLVVLAAVGLVLAGCGERSGDDQAHTSMGRMPECSTMWKAGRTLVTSYDGCMVGERMEAPASRTCKDGRHLVTYASHFWAYAGGTIHHVTGDIADDPAYKQALTC